MPLDFRYHLASLTAVFVALIIGMLLGVAVTDTPGLSSEIAKLREEFHRSESLKDLADRTEQFNKRTLPLLVRNHMSGRNVILVQNAVTFPDAHTSAVREALELAGAQVTAEIVLKPALMNAPVEQLERVYMRSRVSASDRDATPAGMMRALSKDLGNDLHGIALALQRAKLLDVHGDISLPISTVVLLGGGEGSSLQAAKSLDLPLLEACRKRELRVAATETFDIPQSAITLYRKAAPITIDNIDYAAGRIALIFAIANQNQRGNYGYKETADDVMPDITE